MAILSNPQPHLFRRGSRILPSFLDKNRYVKYPAGTVVAEADRATATAVGGLLRTGTAVTESARATVTAFGAGVGALLLAFPTGPSPTTIQRRDRRLVVIDTTVFSNTTTDTHPGVAAAQAQRATVISVGERTVTGASVSVAQRASALGTAAFVNGIASAFAPRATAAASGQVVRNITSAALFSSRATAASVGERTVTGTSVSAAQRAGVVVYGQVPGYVDGVLVAQAQRAVVTSSGQRGFSGVGTTQAQYARVVAFGGPFVPATPVLDEIPILLSRLWRSTTMDFNRNLLEGAEPLYFEITSGGLPPGLVLDNNTGIVTGRTTTQIIVELELTVTNITGTAVSNLFQWVVSRSIPKNGLPVNQNVVTVTGL